MCNEPLTLVEAIRHFADPDVTLDTMVGLRWPEGVCCPTCGCKEVRFIKTRRIWECKAIHSRRQFTAKVHQGAPRTSLAQLVVDCAENRTVFDLAGRTLEQPRARMIQSSHQFGAGHLNPRRGGAAWPSRQTCSA